MNRTLIGALDTVNNILALLIIVISTIAGAATISLHQDGSVIIGGLLGLMVGFVTAAIVCGFLAIMIEIEKHLRALVAGQEIIKARALATSPEPSFIPPVGR